MYSESSWRHNARSADDQYLTLARSACDKRGTTITISAARIAGAALAPWTGHSDQAALAKCVQRLEAAGHAVILFHNFRRRLAKYARVHGLAAGVDVFRANPGDRFYPADGKE